MSNRHSQALREIHEEGRRILESGQMVKATGWAISALAMLMQIFGAEDVRANAFRYRYDEITLSREWLHRPLSIIEYAINDLEKGYVFDLRQLLAGEVFDDLLEMAEYLHGQGYHLPAGSLAGAVLEDSLRRLCRKQQPPIEWAGHSYISTLNDLLRDRVYPKPTWRKIQHWTDLRNDIDHHNFETPEEIKPHDVEQMIEGVQHFIEEYLTREVR